MKIRSSSNARLITLVVGIAIMLAISLPTVIADNESGPCIISGDTRNAAINNSQDQGQCLNIGEKSIPADKHIDKDKAEKLLQLFIKDPVISNNDRANSDLYSYAIGYMYAYESKDDQEKEYKNPLESAYKEWEKNYGQDSIFKKFKKYGSDDCQKAAILGENYNQDLYDR